ncbi:MAG: nucleotide exchange factor GrpE [Bacteroidales bacterium]|jgi:molecular chaperone GrpE|nr:nucleotide exchange factor GrpE [Bacteroidales bacterium]
MFNINHDSKNKEEKKDIKVEQQAENKAVAEDNGKKEEQAEKSAATVTDKNEGKAGECKSESGEQKEGNVENKKEEKREEKREEQPETPEQKLNKEIEKLKKDQAEDKDRYLRLAAEFDNFRRRTAKERLELIETASEGVIKSILPIVDDFERAIAVLKDSKDSDAAKQGTELIYKKMMEMLKNRGVTVIEAIGKDLNTDEHEAIAQIPAKDPKQKGKIVEIAQQGYKLNGKVIRFAKVVMGN